MCLDFEMSWSTLEPFKVPLAEYKSNLREIVGIARDLVKSIGAQYRPPSSYRDAKSLLKASKSR